MRVGVRKEAADGERRVALVPDGVEKLDGVDVVVEHGAGLGAGWTDEQYTAAGAVVADSTTVDHADIVLGVHPPAGGDGPGDSPDGVQWRIALFDPLWAPEPMVAYANSGTSTFSLDLVPRTTKAQTMDVLSSMATVAGYRSALLGAQRLPRLFPMLMTAAGTLAPARVVVLGAGVAGLQAIATARRLGAVVHGYDVRPAAAEQIRSLGAKAIEEAAADPDVEDAGGYARAQSDDEVGRQRALLAPFIEAADVLITTAAIPGRASPLLVTSEMVATMGRGSVVIDLAAERGGNVEPSMADTEIDHHGVLVLAPTRLISEAADHASAMFSNNVVNLLDHLLAEADGLEPNLDDEITAGMLVTHRGAVVHPMVRRAIEERART